MAFNGQYILPAIKSMKDFEKILKSEIEYIVMLEVHIAQLESIMKYAGQHHKKVILHADLIQGLKNDEYSTEYLCQKVKPAGLISTRGSVVKTAKKNKILAIQRLFLLDTLAIETSYRLAEKVHPDYIEVLPGCVPHLIEKVHLETKIPVIAGGLITKKEEITSVLNAGAKAITTSRSELWSVNVG
ncbi:glycerol-3-phosphate responsive antiterminator [Metabacillus niabensis]|uniref:Glycerol uptake operon antiterminator regulatory protein n=1 Tax=Metabacillus niabensis TaxID=324854 RepID=A0ABT9Z756_9BACI|nr:glycerol-3-phosphate responsive antiterminator [Metabacillus niabensis]MDQ0228100.1 glycerol uptake operon antiterminator [Metabacillus niabensis]PAD66063.1 glycerol-3-phosphate responsive antiterminator GlpP [Bacillus sp. 7586-K]